MITRNLRLDIHLRAGFAHAIPAELLDSRRANTPPGVCVCACVCRGAKSTVWYNFRLEMDATRRSSMADPRLAGERPSTLGDFSVLLASAHPLPSTSYGVHTSRLFFASKGRINEKAMGEKEKVPFFYGTTPLSIGRCLWRLHGLSHNMSDLWQT